MQKKLQICEDFPKEKGRSPGKYLIAGAFGGVCTVLSGHPLDTIKVRLQALPGTYKGTWDAVRQLITQEGPFSLYKGMSAPLVTVVPLFALSFVAFSMGKQLFVKPDEAKLSNVQLFLSGMFSGGCTSILTIPAERIKCLLQLQRRELFAAESNVDKCNVTVDWEKKIFPAELKGKNTKKYDGFWDCGMKLWKEGGIRNLYVGSSATLLRDLPSTGIYFFSYERILQFLMAQSSEVTWQPLIAGGSAGIINWIIAMPADVLKSRLQTAPYGRYPKGLRSAFAELTKKEGKLALYHGIVPVMIRAFPVNAVCFLGLEMALKILDTYAPWI